MNVWLAFLLIQAVDFLTTLVGLSLGGRELNPVVSWAMSMFGSPAVGMLISKIGMTVFFLGTCFCLKIPITKVIGLVNVLSAIIVVWNIGVLCFLIK